MYRNGFIPGGLTCDWLKMKRFDWLGTKAVNNFTDLQSYFDPKEHGRSFWYNLSIILALNLT